MAQCRRRPALHRAGRATARAVQLHRELDHPHDRAVQRRQPQSGPLQLPGVATQRGVSRVDPLQLQAELADRALRRLRRRPHPDGTERPAETGPVVVLQGELRDPEVTLGARASRPPFLAASCPTAGGTPAVPGSYEKCGTPNVTLSSKSSFSLVQPVSVASVFVSTKERTRSSIASAA